MSKAKSAKGVTVDFDLLKIKQQIASKPKTTEIKNREKLIDRKLRRRVKTEQPPVPTAESVPVVEPVPVDKNKPVKKIKKGPK